MWIARSKVFIIHFYFSASRNLLMQAIFARNFARDSCRSPLELQSVEEFA